MPSVESQVDQTAEKPEVSKIEKAMEKVDPPAEKKEPTKPLMEKLEAVDELVISRREQELKIMEATVDRKIDKYKKMIEESEKNGQSLVQSEETDRDRVTRNAKEYLKGTGLEDRI